MRTPATLSALLTLLLAAWPAALSAQEDDYEEPPPSEEPEAEATAEEPTGEEPNAPALEEEQAAALREERAVSGDEEEEVERESLDHEYQVGIRAGAGVPFVFALRYGSGPPCDRGGSTFCVFVGSGIVDVDLSFGVTPDLEITAMFRVGMIGVEPSDERTMMAALGIRSYLSPEEMFKLFLGVRALLDFTQSGGVDGWGDVDFGVRGEVGVQLDIVRYVGLYAQVGVNVTFLRAFGISPDLTGGFQIRFP